MAIKSFKAKITGIAPLLQNNPRTVDPFDPFTKKMKKITDKKKKTDDDVQRMRDIETEAKLYFDEKLGVYVPTRWIMGAIAKNGFALTKISKAKLRGAVFTTADKVKLSYSGMDLVKSPVDIVKNEKFTTILILPQAQKRLAKSFPIFHDWSFEFELEYDDSILDREDLVKILTYSAKYGGFGDFRPSYGRALVEFYDE